MSFESCQKFNGEVNCKNNCIKPKGLVTAKIKNVIITVREKKKDKEVYPPSKGIIMILGNHIFCKKKNSKREKEVFVTPDYPSATTVYIPKIKKGWQCFSFKVDDIVSIRHSIFDSILGVYILDISVKNYEYIIKIGKGGKLSLSKKLDKFIKKIQNHSIKNL